MICVSILGRVKIKVESRSRDTSNQFVILFFGIIILFFEIIIHVKLLTWRIIQLSKLQQFYAVRIIFNRV